MSCPTGKVEHHALSSAHAHADSIFRKDGHQPNVYVCQMCGFLHVGGGRASDRPVHRPVPIITTSRPAFVQKKIDKGHNITLDELILEKLRTTLITDTGTAAMFNTSLSYVTRLREQHQIPNCHRRKAQAIEALLKANPQRSRKEIAQLLKVKLNSVLRIATMMGLPAVRNRGVKSHLFGLKQRNKQKQLWANNPELIAKLSTAVKEKQWGPSQRAEERRQQLREQNRLPEIKEKRRERAKRYWSSPEGLLRKQFGVTKAMKNSEKLATP